MNRKILVIALAAALAPAAPAFAGGQANIRVADLPKSFVAGETAIVTFTVQDAVGRPLSKLEPTLIAQLGRLRVEVPAARAKAEGAYQAIVRFPSAGAWTLTVDSHYCGNTNVLRGVQVLASK